jgi:hypothetical protein
MQSRLVLSLGRKATPTLLGAAVIIQKNESASGFTRLEYWEHNPADFDFYITKPTAKDLPVLLHKFDVEGLEVWPWIWTHPNNDGPHHVFVGVSKESLVEIQRLRDESNQNNILIIASESQLREMALARNDPGIYERCQCGLVVDSKLELLNHEAKILMLDDERVIAFDRLMLV